MDKKTDLEKSLTLLFEKFSNYAEKLNNLTFIQYYFLGYNPFKRKWIKIAIYVCNLIVGLLVTIVIDNSIINIIISFIYIDSVFGLLIEWSRNKYPEK